MNLRTIPLVQPLARTSITIAVNGQLLPASAAAGQAVSVSVHSNNIDGVSHSIYTEVWVLDGGNNLLASHTKQVAPGGYDDVPCSFVMPNSTSVEIFIWIEVDGSYDYAVTIPITLLTAPTPGVYSGTIADFYFKKGTSTYKYSFGQIPASVAVDGQPFSVMVQFQASSSNPGDKIFGCEVTVKSPLGLISTPAIDWAGLSPGEMGSDFGLFALPSVGVQGQWLISIRMILEGGTVVATWPQSVLFTAGPAASVYGGDITDFYVKKGTSTYRLSEGKIPAAVSIKNETFEIGVGFKASESNPGSQYFSCYITLTGPEGNVITPTRDRTYFAPGQATGTWGPFGTAEMKITVGGQWKLLIEIKLDDGTVIDSWGTDVILNVALQTATITNVKVNKESEGLKPVPVTVVANGETFEIYLTITNTYTEDYNARLEFTVIDPAGTLYSFETSYFGLAKGEIENVSRNVTPTSPVPVNKAGAWLCTIRLITQAGYEIATFSGVCLNATGVTGSITSMWFNHGINGSKQYFGTTTDADEQTFEVGATCRNTTTDTVQMGLQVEVWTPSGVLRPALEAVDYTGIAPKDIYTKEYNFGKVDKVGEWMVKLKLLVYQSDEVMAEWPTGDKGLLFKAAPVASVSELTITGYRKKVAATGATSVEVTTGDVVEVDISFKYSSPAARSLDLVVGLMISPGFDYPVTFPTEVSAGTDLTKTTTVEIPIAADVGLKNDTYDIVASLGGKGDTEANAVIVSGMVEGGIGGIFDTIGSMVLMMVMMMMMSMMMENTRGLYEPAGTPPRPKPVTEAVVKGAKKAGEYAGGAVKKVTKYFREKGEEEKRVTEYFGEGGED